MTGGDCTQCGVNQDVLSGKKRQDDDGIGFDFWELYLAKLKSRSKTRQKTYLQERVEPYLRYINWDNATFERDMTAFWVAVSRYAKRNEPNLIYLLDWVKKKNSLHPRQVIKVLNK